MIIDVVISEVFDAATWCLGRMLATGGGAATRVRPVLLIDSVTTERMLGDCNDKVRSQRIWGTLIRRMLGFKKGEAPASLCVVAGVVHEREGLHYWNYVIDPEQATLQVENSILCNPENIRTARKIATWWRHNHNSTLRVVPAPENMVQQLFTAAISMDCGIFSMERCLRRAFTTLPNDMANTATPRVRRALVRAIRLWNLPSFIAARARVPTAGAAPRPHAAARGRRRRRQRADDPAERRREKRGL